MKYTIIALLLFLCLSSKSQVTFSPEFGVEDNVESSAYFTLRFGYEYKQFTTEAVILPPFFNYVNPAYFGLSTGYQFFLGAESDESLLEKNDNYWSVTPLLLTYYRLNDLDKPKGYNGNRYETGGALRVAYKFYFIQASYVDDTPLVGIGLKAILR